jgi:hypothetical protein
MPEKAHRRVATDSPQSAARFVRRIAEGILAGSARVSRFRAEYEALAEWARAYQRVLPFGFIEKFRFIGDGAEHRVYKNDADVAHAIKATRPNTFGYSVAREGAWAKPLEYLKRLAWQNHFFGDDTRLVGVAFDEEQMEIVTSQPWISSHLERPNPTLAEIDDLMNSVGFLRPAAGLPVPIYLHHRWQLVVADAHDRNIIRDRAGHLCPIDVVIGRPADELFARLRSAPPAERGVEDCPLYS